MIDTLKLSLNETLIRDSAKIKVVPGTIDFDTGMVQESDLFITESGQIIKGKKAFLNTDLYNLTILPKYSVQDEIKFNNHLLWKSSTTLRYIPLNFNSEPVNLKNNSRIYLQTSLPKIKNYLKKENNYNLNTVHSFDIPMLLKFIYNDLDNNGINADFDGSEISRLDTFNNIQTENNFNQYATVFNELNFSRKRNLNFGGETFLYYNKSTELCIYNKSKALEKMNIKIPENQMRFENRFLNKKAYFNRFKTSHIKSLLHYDEFKKEMVVLGNEIFDRKKIEQNIINEDSLRQILLNLKSTNRFWIRDFFYNEGINFVLSKVDKDVLLKILRDLLLKDKFYKIRRELNSRKFSNTIFQNNITINLFDEMKNKYFENLRKVA